LRTINGQQVNERQLAADLVNAEWVAEWPVPVAHRIAELQAEFAAIRETASPHQPPNRPTLKKLRLTDRIQKLLERSGHEVSARGRIDSIIEILGRLLAEAPAAAVDLPRSPDSYEKV
jgi:hypothetical protein